ncbi:MAG: YihY/virulence factor BrkB family protein [Acidobacteria bacterium]|nr:YihY/virulence factor BrkB family protein [Acidobacteriota bacterium]
MVKELFRPRSGKAAQHVFRSAFLTIFEKECPTTAAAMAFFCLFTLFPFLILLVATSDNLLGYYDIRPLAVQKVLEIFPGARDLIRRHLDEIVFPSGKLLLTCLLVFFWSASWVYNILEDALNRAWGLDRRRSFVRRRLYTAGMIFVCGTLLAFSMLVTGVLTSIRSEAGQFHFRILYPALMKFFWQMILFVMSWTFTVLSFTLLYKIVPNTRVKLVEALPGALVAGSAWQVASYLFAKLVPHFDYQEVYGSVGAAIALLSWVYISSMILLFGAHLSAHLHREPLPKLAYDAEASLKLETTYTGS